MATPPRKHLPKAPPTEAPHPDNSTATLGQTTPGQPSTPRTLVDQGANPAGPPEGTDHGHAGADPEATTPASQVDPTGVSQADLAESAQHLGPGSPTGRLIRYLTEHHPQEVGRVTPEGPEHPADTAVRLLSRLGARGTTQARCQEAYCNLPAAHEGAHGWINVS